ncbi:MAG: flagellar basal-body MS-ring/collar protein FliF [Gammaproteobacteria bacterium]
MALVKTEDLALQSRGFGSLSVFRQLAFIVAMAASIALGITVFNWADTPNYSLLYSNLTEQDAAEISNSLQQAGIEYKFTEGSGTILVDNNKVHDARLKLAAEGLPRGAGAGFEMLENQGGFGVSQFMENARYQRALEGELARTISAINSVRSARVHLAIPKQSAFIRNRKKPTASVTIDLFPGRMMEQGQVAAITHMVSASIPNLESDQVTVIDQKGRLLTSPNGSDDMHLTSTQFAHRQRLEQYYIERIEDILTPIVGMGAVQAQVSADIDFTITEQTQESFNPDLPAIRSEQTFDEQRSGGATAAGIPGSLSNSAPGAAGQEATAGAEGSASVNSSKRTTRNYELDKTISHIKIGGGTIKRLSVGVVVDNKIVFDEDLEEDVSTPLSKEEVDRITTLVKEAVGFDMQRGDSVNVVNAAFTVPPEPEPLPEPSMMDNPALWGYVKQGFAGIVVLFLVFGVLRPVLRELVVKGETVNANQPRLHAQVADGGLQNDQLSLSGAGGEPKIASPSNYETNLNNAQTLAAQDPKRVAQVVNNWVGSDG